MRAQSITLFLLCSLGACSGPSAQVRPAPAQSSGLDTESPHGATAAAGVDDPQLRALLVDHWEWLMQRSPVWATTLGDHRYDDRLADNSQAAIDTGRRERDGFLERARALSEAAFSARDRTTHALFVQELEDGRARDVCESHLWSVSAMGNAVTRANILPKRHKVVTAEEGRNLVARYRQIPQRVDNAAAHLRRGATMGLIANAESLRRTVAQLEIELAKPLEDWVLMEPAGAEHTDWSAAERDTFAAEVTAVVRDDIAPAYRRYRDAVAELAPKGRGADAVGLVALPNGAACYAARLQGYTGLPKTADDLHALGHQEIGRIKDEMRQLGEELFASNDLAAIIDRLRTDPALYFESEEQVVAAAEAALAQAQARMGHWFGILPKADCVVTPIPDYEAPYSTIAYYRAPHADGSKPGEYYINTFEPKVRPRFETQVLAYHEAIPGHHLQIAIAQERTELPAFRRYGGNTAFAEGWALYTERLSNEMGLYSTDLDRMGMLNYDAWRASRLVVDTGIHAKGWTREQAEQFMLEHTALTPENIRNEVDRYISWPGQAVAYKVGQLEFLRLRAWAKAEIGESFDIKAFHDAALGNGAVTLPVLATQIHDYVGSARQ